MKKIIYFFKSKIKEFGKEKSNKIAKNSLITEIIKKKNLNKFYDFQKENDLVNIH